MPPERGLAAPREIALETLARTVARRRCGTCGRTLGLALWPWSGKLFLTTHGLCDDCFKKVVRKTRTRTRANTAERNPS